MARSFEQAIITIAVCLMRSQSPTSASRSNLSVSARIGTLRGRLYAALHPEAVRIEEVLTTGISNNVPVELRSIVELKSRGYPRRSSILVVASLTAFSSIKGVADQ